MPRFPPSSTRFDATTSPVPSAYIDYVVNAFWLEQGRPGVPASSCSAMAFPRASTSVGRTTDYFSGGLDIVAHEMAHGVTSQTSKLVYVNESGALNESFSDIIATSVEFYFQQAGSGDLQADYLLGEDVTWSVVPGGLRGSRLMADPSRFGDPDHYDLRRRGPEDNGGVHSNSGIPNHAFYLAIEGGRHRVSGLSVQGVGAARREQIEKSFFRAFVYRLTRWSTFSVARQETILSARELYGAGSDAERAIAQAWAAVGVK